MFGFGIRYLNGFVAASEAGDMERAEWPPHPGRVFMALAAAHFETGADSDERKALLWLEGSGRDGEISPPRIHAADAVQRAIVKHYVPVNDKAGPAKALLQSVPLTRDKQERVFARAWLDHDIVYLHWPELEPSADDRAALEKLCSQVTRVGHSSSLVHMWVAGPNEAGEPNWTPDEERATTYLRVPGPGTLDYLEEQFNQGACDDYADLRRRELEASGAREKREVRKELKENYNNVAPPRHRPRLTLAFGYAPSIDNQEDKASSVGTVFSPHCIAVQLLPRGQSQRRLDLVSTLQLVNRWRAAILSNSNDLSERARRVLSGHDANGGTADEPHLAFMPMAFVGHPHADGHIMGMGLVLPDGLTREERREALRAIAAVKEIRLGKLGVWQAEPVTASSPHQNLRGDMWTAWPEGATHWSTVTPIVFDRHPKNKNRADRTGEVQRMIAESCERIGLPQPRDVIATNVSAHFGAPPSFVFPQLKRKDGSKRQHTHTILTFDEPVVGPVLLGAGRFRGYGMCRPVGDLM